MGKSSTEEARLTAEILNNPKFQKMARQKSLLGLVNKLDPRGVFQYIVQPFYHKFPYKETTPNIPYQGSTHHYSDRKSVV